MHKTNKWSAILALILIASMLLSIGVYAAPGENAGAESVLICMDQSQNVTLTFPLSEAQQAAIEAAGADAVEWTLQRTATYANAGEIHPINGETAMFPNEKDVIPLKELTYGAPSRWVTPFGVVADSVTASVDGSTLTLSFSTTAAVSRGNVSIPHSNGGDFLDICGVFTLTGTAGETTVATQENFTVKPYES